MSMCLLREHVLTVSLHGCQHDSDVLVSGQGSLQRLHALAPFKATSVTETM
jgi:hypothetical protein